MARLARRRTIWHQRSPRVFDEAVVLSQKAFAFIDLMDGVVAGDEMVLKAQSFLEISGRGCVREVVADCSQLSLSQ